ncbi:hypothetical protein RHMOL_Rhmol01G0178000 [Rhododendron molle]|uniref:Uncharacterized protein n=1 Tax=Rhododendron molle TaxID=49168 RepID=A0ACC0Q4J4_RHOML|nr:hypothetical protein RHMOL_Rhmol01G0178000 [Rhododendron molle]
MADHGIGGGEGELVDQPRDRGEPMAVEQAEERVAEGVVDQSAEVASGGDGVEDHEQEATSGEEPSAVKAEPRATNQAGAVEPEIDPVGLNTTSRGSPVVDSGSGDVEDSGAGGDDIGPSGPRRGTRRKARG